MKLITTEEVAVILITTPDTVRKYIREGKLKASRVGKHFLIKEEEIEHFLERESIRLQGESHHGQP